MPALDIRVGQVVKVIQGHTSLESGLIIRASGPPDNINNRTNGTIIFSKKGSSYPPGHKVSFCHYSEYVTLLDRKETVGYLKELYDGLESEIKKKQQEMKKLEVQVEYMEKYNSDEEAVAATLLDVFDKHKDDREALKKKLEELAKTGMNVIY